VHLYYSLEPLENEKCSLFSGTCVDGCEEDSKQGGWNVKKMEGAVQGLGRYTLGGDRGSYGQKDERTCASYLASDGCFTNV